MDIPDPQYKTEDGSALRIWRDTAKNNFRSEQTGLPQFDEVVYVEVISPGSRDSTPTFEVVRYFPESAGLPPLYGMNYPRYKNFIDDFEKNEKTDASMAGTPLGQWAEMSKSMVASLRVQSVYTVEMLASLPDTKLTIVGPDGRTWRTKAQAYIDAANGMAQYTKMAAENQQLKDDAAAQNDRIAQLAAQVQQLLAAQAASGAPVAQDGSVAAAAAQVLQTAQDRLTPPPSPATPPNPAGDQTGMLPASLTPPPAPQADAALQPII